MLPNTDISNSDVIVEISKRELLKSYSIVSLMVLLENQKKPFKRSGDVDRFVEGEVVKHLHILKVKQKKKG